MRGDLPLLERFFSNIDKDGPGGCWLWTGSLSTQAHYGQFFAAGAPLYAHRFSYDYHVGPCPRGSHIHHKCATPACVNPDHLEPLTPAEHRSCHRMGVCKRGHTMAPENTYVTPKGGKRCRECRRLTMQRFKERHAA